MLFQGRVFRLSRNDVILPNGRRTTLDVIEHPGAVVIVPFFENGDVLLIKQFRFAARDVILELPAGTLEPGERPLSCARRELIEETGYGASRWMKLTAFYSAPGFCTEMLHAFRAEGLRPATGEQDPDECISTVRVPVAEAIEMTRNGKIRDAKSIAGIHLAWERVHGDNHPRKSR